MDSRRESNAQAKQDSYARVQTCEVWLKTELISCDSSLRKIWGSKAYFETLSLPYILELDYVCTKHPDFEVSGIEGMQNMRTKEML